MKANGVPLADESENSARQRLARRLRDARVRAGLSQAQLAELLNLTQSGISLYEAGNRSIGPDLVWEFSRILNRPLSYFLDEPDHGFRYPSDSEIAHMIEGLEQYPEDIAELRLYLEFLQERRD